MNIPTICPCCSNTMLHHIGNHRDYWFCRSCWQKMPDLGEASFVQFPLEKHPVFLPSITDALTAGAPPATASVGRSQENQE